MQPFLNFSLCEQLFLIFVLFCVFSILEYFGAFHFLEKKIKIFKNKKFLSVREAIDYIIEHKVKHSNIAYSLLITAGIKVGYFKLRGEKKTEINQELADLLVYAKEGEITIYGQTQISIKNLHPLKLSCIETDTWFFKENWHDNYNSIYQKGKIFYTNLQVKKADLQQLIEKYKL